MTINVKVKSLASKNKPVIDSRPLTVPDGIKSADELVENIVRHSVEVYNSKTPDAQMLPYLTNEDMERGTHTGKIGFGRRRNENQQDPGKAVENALQCFADGIFRMFINDDEAGFGDKIDIKEGDEVTFIRLTMLASRLW